jgi:arsenate reductase
MTPRQGLRMAEDGAKAVKHGDADAILDAMMVDPSLIERPLVETDKGVRLGRPTARIAEIL